MDNSTKIFLLQDSTVTQVETVGVAKVLQSEKTHLKYWTQWIITPLKNAKIQTKTHEMEVFEALEDDALESHSRQNRHMIHKVL